MVAIYCEQEEESAAWNVAAAIGTGHADKNVGRCEGRRHSAVRLFHIHVALSDNLHLC